MDSSTNNRLLSLDVFRGMTIAAMVLVNNPGSWSTIYSPLKHADWHGWTPTDLVFPFFVFIVGISITLALGRRVETGGVTRTVYFKIFRRAALIFLLGLFLAGFPYFDLTTIRIFGVLQRIALCYLVASLIFVNTKWKSQAVIAAGLLFVYWALMTLINVPGCEITTINDKACNLAAYLDRVIIGENHIYRGGKVYDPEGILSTLPAISTALIGVLTGHWLRTTRADYEKVGGLFFAGVSLTAIGWMWDFFFPINKALWTSSYVVFTAGLALCLLGFCYWLIDLKNYKTWTKPFVIFGVNALALYVFSGLLARILGLIKLNGADNSQISLQGYIFDNFFAAFAAPINASLLYAVSYVLLWLFLMWLLYRKQIFIKV